MIFHALPGTKISLSPWWGVGGAVQVIQTPFFVKGLTPGHWKGPPVQPPAYLQGPLQVLPLVVTCCWPQCPHPSGVSFSP